MLNIIQKSTTKASLVIAVLLLLPSVVLSQVIPVIVSYNTPQTYPAGNLITPLSPNITGRTPSADGRTTTYAGSGSAGSINGTGTSASFNQPLGEAVDAQGNVYVADANSDLIRKITAGGVVTTLAGSGARGSANGTGTAATFYHPVGLAVDASGNVYVADEENNMIRKITASGVVTTLAGSTMAGSNDGTGTAASFNSPCGVVLDAANNVYVADYSNNKIRKITPAGVVTTYAGTGVVGAANSTLLSSTFNHPFSVVFDNSGNLYVADRLNHMIRKISTAGVVSTLAGNGTAGFIDFASGTSAEFNGPTEVTSDGTNIYVTDEANLRVREITPAGYVTTLAGSGAAGSSDGAGGAATFNDPFGIAADPKSGLLYEGDYNNVIRTISYGAYSISPDLSPGLNFDPAIGIISGTPAAQLAAINYTISAHGGNGAISIPVSITVLAPGTLNLSDQNYLVNYMPRDSGMMTNANIYSSSNDKSQVTTDITYFDGLGRLMQTVQAKGSPGGWDLVQPTGYDQYGRESTKYLHYTGTTNDGSYKSTAIADQAAYYNPTNSATLTQQPNGIVNTAYPEAVTGYESSPLDRVVEEGNPGISWQLTTSGLSGSGHTVKATYGNNASEVVQWTVNTTGNGATGTTNYAANSLDKMTLTDENGNTKYEYKDKQGNIVCKIVQNGSVSLATYYIYDDYNNLAYVLPPIPSATQSAQTAYPTSFVETDAVFLNYMYGYHYDNQNRQVEKKVPGEGWDYIVYNSLNQVVATQDANQQQTPQVWTFYKYDAQGRSMWTGLWNNGGTAITRANLQTIVNNFTGSLWETRPSGGYPTNAAWPTTNQTGTLTVTYYDDYTFGDFSSLPTLWNYRSSASSKTKGLVTCTKTWVFGSTAVLYKLFYYDDFGRNIRTYAEHYLGGTTGLANLNNYDEISNTYDFTNEITATTRQHFTSANTTTPAVTIANSYNYDHRGRKKQTLEAIANGSAALPTPILLSELDYNEIGQLATKNLHSENNGTNYLQAISYSYNERGWLLTSSTSANGIATNLFNLDLRYNTPASGTQEFNGNISEMHYTGQYSGAKVFDYTYDPLNRLIHAASTGGTLDETVAYDVLGNITGLTRGGTGNGTLGYTYTNNQLTSVTGYANRSYGYDPNGNAQSDGTNKLIHYNLFNLPQTITQNGTTITTYVYDADGNKLRNISTADGSWDYINGIVYHNNVIAFIQTEEGRATLNGSTYTYTYDLKDNLGNVRVSLSKNSSGTAVPIQEDEYYAFGLSHLLYDSSNGNRYLYNSKEQQADLTSQYDYGARFYDPVIARWTTIDPDAENSKQFSPYNYAANNPILNIDPDGMDYKPGEGEFGGDLYTEADAQELGKKLQQSSPPGQGQKKSFQEIMKEWDKTRLALAPKLKPLKSFWDRLIHNYLDPNGYNYNGIKYDDNGNPISVIHIQMAIVPWYLTGPGDIEFVTERIAGYFVKSSVVMEGETYTRTVSILGNVTKESNLAGLLKAFESDAEAKGAATIILKGITVENEKLFNPTVAKRFGYVFKQLSDKSFELIKSLK